MHHVKKLPNVLPIRFLALLCGIALSATAAVQSEADPNPPTLRSTQGAWPITRQWTPAEVRRYAQWVEHIYDMKTTGSVEQRTAKLERVLTDPEMNLLEDPAFAGEGSNPQLPKAVMRAMHNLMDCGKFSAFMPAYYAYRRGLPWMTAVVRSGGGDVRTSAYNIPVGAANSFTSPSVAAFFNQAVGSFISGNYRINLDGKNAQQSDTVPVAMNKTHLLPGTINYIDGHCLVLAKVTEYGELYFLNCSTTITRDIFTYNGMNTVTGVTPKGDVPGREWEGCYQGLRAPRYPIAVTDASGRVIEVRRRTDEEMKEFGFSTEQYEVIREMNESQSIEVDGLKAQSYHDFIRLRMKTVDAIAPVRFMEQYALEILDAYRFREDFVQDAWRDVQANGPITFPENRPDENIFQAHGRWETWSSPSSDVDRRNKYFYLADWLEYAVRMFAVQPAFIDLTGLEDYGVASQADLALALVDEKNRIFAQHAMEYTNSKGEKVRLTLLDIEERLYDMSFDPNHPPELRWGAPIGSPERATAPQTYTPVPGGTRVAMEDAYRLQAFYRTVGQRETSESYLREMFTEGFPVRQKLDKQVGKWSYATDILIAGVTKKKARAPEPAATPAAPDTPVAAPLEPATEESAGPAPRPRPAAYRDSVVLYPDPEPDRPARTGARRKR